MRKKSSNVHVMEDLNQLKSEEWTKKLYGAVVKNVAEKCPCTCGRDPGQRGKVQTVQGYKGTEKFHETH